MVLRLVFGAVFRLVRRMLLLSAIVAAVTGGMRHLAPHPDAVYGGLQLDAGDRLHPVEQLYRLFYDVANTPRFPVFEELWVVGPTQVPPDIGTPGHGETAMGKSLHNLRTRLVGGQTDPVGEKSLFDAIEYELTRPEWRSDPPPSTIPPPAEAKRLRVGE